MNIICYASGSRANCYKIDDGETSCLLEIGITWKELIRKGAEKPPVFCLLSHEHRDHSKGWREYVSHGNILMASAGTLNALGTEGFVLEPLTSYMFGTFEVMPFPLVHGDPESGNGVEAPLGYVIKSTKTNKTLLFATDTVNVFHRFRDVDIFLIECNHDEETIDPECDDTHLKWALDSHMSLKTLKQYLSRQMEIGTIEEVILCHLSSKNAVPEKMAEEVKKLTGAITGVAKTNGGIWRMK